MANSKRGNPYRPQCCLVISILPLLTFFLTVIVNYLVASRYQPGNCTALSAAFIPPCEYLYNITFTPLEDSPQPFNTTAQFQGDEPSCEKPEEIGDDFPCFRKYSSNRVYLNRGADYRWASIGGVLAFVSSIVLWFLYLCCYNSCNPSRIVKPRWVKPKSGDKLMKPEKAIITGWKARRIAIDDVHRFSEKLTADGWICFLCLQMPLKPQDVGNILQLDCHHVFHTSCFENWERKNTGWCPACQG